MSDVYNGGNNMTIDLSGYATKEEMNAAILQNGKGVFWANYGTTSRDDIITASIAGKVVLCRENFNDGTQNIYVLLRRNADDTFDFLSILDNTQIKVNISTSGTWTKTVLPLGGDIPLEIVEFRSVPGVGWQANKTYSDVQTAMLAGKTPVGVMYKNNLPDCMLVFRGSIVLSDVPALLFYATGTTLEAEVYSQNPYSTNMSLALTANNNVVQNLTPIVGSLYAPNPDYTPIDGDTINVINNGSYVIVDTAYSSITVNIVDQRPNTAANVCIWFVMNDISFTSFQVYFNSVQLMPPPDLSAALNAGAGHYSLDVRGNFFTLKKVMSM